MEIRFKARKVVKSGYTHYYALPPAWIAHHGILPKEQLISKLQDDGSLHIEPPQREVSNDTVTG